MSPRIYCLHVLVLLWMTCYTFGYRPYPDPGPDIRPSGYCSRRPGEQCCPGRDDYCTVPILDTICYCDIFCNRTIADCCPDFWGLCLGVEPPPGAMTTPRPPQNIKNNCIHKGVLYGPGSLIKSNCNNCTCVTAASSEEYNWKCTQNACLIRKQIIDNTNDGNYGWQAGNYSFLWGMSLNDGIKDRLGTLRPTLSTTRMTSLTLKEDEVLPASFDSRQEWGDHIHPIVDQGNCGASFAFSTVSVAADRLSIHSQGFIKEPLSAQNLIACDTDARQKGCDGGYLDRAWWYMRKKGVVSEDCYPYTSSNSDQAGTCQLPRIQYPVRSAVSCPSNRRVSNSRVYQTTPPYRVPPKEHDIMVEIYINGPVQATLEVKEDFYVYSGGVYKYTKSSNFLPSHQIDTGFHSVKIVGWGTDYSTGRAIKYWLCANSWGRSWGEDGYFRIVRGDDECKIESFVIGVWGRVNGRQVTLRSSRRGGIQGDEPRRRARNRRRRHRRHNKHNRHNNKSHFKQSENEIN